MLLALCALITLLYVFFLSQELQAKLDSSQSSLEQSKQQNSALKARNRTLASDCKDLRAKVSELTAQLAHRDQILAEVGDQALNSSRRKMQEIIERLQRENSKLHAQLARSEDQISKLRHPVHSQGTTMPSLLPALPGPVQSENVTGTEGGGMGTGLTPRHGAKRNDLLVRHSLSADTAASRFARLFAHNLTAIQL